MKTKNFSDLTYEDMLSPVELDEYAVLMNSTNNLYFDESHPKYIEWIDRIAELDNLSECTSTANYLIDISDNATATEPYILYVIEAETGTVLDCEATFKYLWQARQRMLELEHQYS